MIIVFKKEAQQAQIDQFIEAFLAAKANHEL